MLTGATNVVTEANGSNGVILLAPAAIGQQVTVLNMNSSNALLVYPDSGGSVNGGATNAPASLAANTGATYVCIGVGPSSWSSLII